MELQILGIGEILRRVIFMFKVKVKGWRTTMKINRHLCDGSFDGLNRHLSNMQSHKQMKLPVTLKTGKRKRSWYSKNIMKWSIKGELQELPIKMMPYERITMLSQENVTRFCHSMMPKCQLYVLISAVIQHFINILLYGVVSLGYRPELFKKMHAMFLTISKIISIL